MVTAEARARAAPTRADSGAVSGYHRHMKIYTRSGDDGTTGLYGGQRVPKTSARVEAYGAVDEANAAVGLARALLGDSIRIDAVLDEVQHALFDVGADLATPDGSPSRDRIRPIDGIDVARIEEAIDAFEAELEPLRNFVLPGGKPAAAQLQVARTVVRRAEREVVKLAQAEVVGDQLRVYLNRLSDLLFVLARVVNARSGVADDPWTASGRRGSER